MTTFLVLYLICAVGFTLFMALSEDSSYVEVIWLIILIIAWPVVICLFGVDKLSKRIGGDL